MFDIIVLVISLKPGMDRIVYLAFISETPKVWVVGVCLYKLFTQLEVVPWLLNIQ